MNTGPQGHETEWSFVGSSTQPGSQDEAERSDFKIGGVRVWTNRWEDLGVKVLARDPRYGTERELGTYKIQDGDREAVFAAGEVGAAGIFLFYVPSAVEPTAAGRPRGSA